MDFKDLVTLYFERSNAMQTFWNFYITIILALLAFFGAATKLPRKKLIAGIISFTFVVFASVNFLGLREVANARLTAKMLLDQHTFTNPPDNVTYQAFDNAIRPPAIWKVTAMHLTGDIFLLGSIWFLVLFRDTKQEHSKKAT